MFICTRGKAAQLEATRLTYELRKKGIKCDYDHVGKSLKAQFKYADKTGARYVVVIGESELEQGVYVLRDMQESSECTVEKQELFATIEQGAGNHE